MLENLFYSPSEKIAFFIPPHYYGAKVKELVETMQNHANELAEIAGKSPDDVSIIDVLQSSRYKNMKVFYIKDCETAPEQAYVINESWTMVSWYSN